MTDLPKILQDPGSYYDQPHDVLDDEAFNDEQKHEILKQWEYDAKELLVADEENMAGESASYLHRIREALHELAERK